MAVPFVDLTREYADLQEDLDHAVSRVMDNGWFVLGDEVSAFEEEFADYLGTSAAVGTNSGSDAIELGLQAVGVDEGDEVVTVAHSFVATANAIKANGARPKFVDVDPKSYCVDIDELEAAVDEDTAAIVPVHLYGRPVAMDEVMRIAEAHGVPVVEDACQAHGATYGGQPVGTFGEVGCFSFYPVKNLGAYGDGGVIVTDDRITEQRLRTLRNVGQSEKYHHTAVGRNSRLDEMQAAILREKLPYLDEWNTRRREIASRYRDELADTGLILPEGGSSGNHVFHLYVVRPPEREQFRSHLEERKIDTLVHYPTPIHEQPAYSEFNDLSLPVTEQVTEEVVSLPLYPYMTDEEVGEVIRGVRTFYER